MPKDKETPKILYSPGFFRDGFVFEQVADLKYAQGETDELLEAYGMGDIVYQPLIRCPWPLASNSTQYTDHNTLWDEVKTFIHEYLFLPNEELYDVLTAWVLATWTPEMWTVVPYVFFYGPVASGKTRGLEVLQRLSFRGILASNISGPALFRSCEEWHPTLFLDETEIYNQDVKIEIIGLLNAGYRKGQYAIRAKRTEHGTELETFDVFGFKALAGTDALIATLESRSIMIRMIKNQLPVKQFIDERKALELRNRLLGYRLFNLQCEDREPCERYEPFLRDICLDFGDGRLNELFNCLLFVAGDEKENILKYAKKVSEIRDFEEKASNEAEIIRILLDKDLEIEEGAVLTRDVRSLFNTGRDEKEKWKTESVGRILRRLGFIKVHTRRGNGFLVDLDRVKYFANIYGVDIPLRNGSFGSHPSPDPNLSPVGEPSVNDYFKQPSHGSRDDGAKESAQQLKKLRELK